MGGLYTVAIARKKAHAVPAEGQADKLGDAKAAGIDNPEKHAVPLGASGPDQQASRRGSCERSYFNALAESGDAESSRSISWVSVERVPTFFVACPLKSLRE